jgi:predicted dehydrogenase
MWLGPAPYRPYNEERVHYNWHFMKDYGTGDLGNWGAHWLDAIRYLLDLDLPKSVSAVGGAWVARDAREWPDTQTVLYEFPELTVLWELRQWTRFLVDGMANGAELGGEKGTMVIDRAGWTFHPRKGEAEKHPGSELERAHALNFADCILGTAKPAASIEEGHKTAVMVHLGNMATSLGRRLEFEPATETIRNDPEANQHLGRAYREPWRLPAWAKSGPS